MRFLIDQNLPVRLATLIAGMGWTVDHVASLGLAEALDDDVWSHAEAIGATVISKDGDFVEKALRSDRAALLWLRIGNTPNRRLYDLIRAELPQAILRLNTGEHLVEVRA